VLRIAARHGWLPGARYTNLRDVRKFDRLGFLDIDWHNYDFEAHLSAARSTRPILTVARDVDSITLLSRTLDQAEHLAAFATSVIIVPKSLGLASSLEALVPPKFVLGYSVPSRYGGTRIAPARFKRRVHLLGGRPDVQRELAKVMNVVSFDCNRFTLDASYGDYFDGDTFRPHPHGGYEQCLKASIVNINKLWALYGGPTNGGGSRGFSASNVRSAI
jgi:hypothetical protein